MIVHINKDYLTRCDNTLEDKAAGYTEIIISYLLSYLLNDDTEYEFEFDFEFDEKVIEKTTQNVRAIFPEYFIMNYSVSKLDKSIYKQGITIDKKN